MGNSESENNTYTPQTPVMPPPNTEAKGPAVPRARRIKPMVEGINAPVRTAAAPVPSAPPPAPSTGQSLSGSSVVPPKVTLTDPEMQLIDDTAMPVVSGSFKSNEFGLSQKIELPSQNRKFSWNRLIWAILISLLAVSVVLGVLFWYNSGSGSGQNEFLGLFSKRADNPNSVNTQIQPAPLDNPVPLSASSAPDNNLIPTTTPPAATGTASAPAPIITQIKIIATPTNFLNVRSGPSLSSTILTKVHPGDIYTYTELKDGWYDIILKNASSGWVFGQYVEVIK